MAWSSGLQLHVTAGNDEGRVFLLNSPEITLGRAVETSESSPGWVLFSEPTVSRIHALLQWDDERQCYVLQHRSRTNGSMVGGVAVDGYPLRLHEEVSLGLLKFELEPAEVRTGKLGNAVQKPSGSGPAPGVFDALNSYADQSKKRERENMAGIAGLVDAGSRDEEAKFNMIVIQGPDKGASYPLSEPVLVIGRLQGPADPRSSAGVLLHDASVPPEQALLVWQDRAATYGILQSDSSSQATRIRRMTNGIPRDIIVRSDIPTVLNERDAIIIGRTAMILAQGKPQASINELARSALSGEVAEEQEMNRRQQQAQQNMHRSPLRSWRNSAPPQNYEQEEYQPQNQYGDMNRGRGEYEESQEYDGSYRQDRQDYAQRRDGYSQRQQGGQYYQQGGQYQQQGGQYQQQGGQYQQQGGQYQQQGGQYQQQGGQYQQQGGQYQQQGGQYQQQGG
ncbi:FHA domain-containing protein, partial [bacterium]|nr:FHA domain-containing protein [bacterium]